MGDNDFNEITTEELEKRLSADPFRASISGAIITEAVLLNQGVNVAKFVVFTNCTFKESVSIENINLQGLRFSNCTFEKELFLFDVTIGHRTSINGCTFNSELNFNKCNLKETHLTAIKASKGIEIRHCAHETLRIASVICGDTGLYLYKSTVKLNTDFEQVTCEMQFHISECIFEGHLRTQNVIITKGSFVFRKGKYEKSVRIWGGSVKKSLIFNEGEFSEKVIVKSVKIPEGLTITGGTFNQFFHFRLTSNSGKYTVSPPQEIYLSDSAFKNGLTIEENGYSNHAKAIDRVTIQSSKKFEGEMSFSNLVIKVMNLSGPNHNGRIVFDKVAFNQVIIDKFSNFSNLQFLNITSYDTSSILSINNSYLGKAQFFNANLSSFSRIVITDSQISEVIASNVRWPDDIYTSSGGVKDNVDTLARKRENYRQLKQAMNSQGNKFEALYFEEKETKAYHEWLTQMPGRYRDKFILWTNRSNDHGRNWARPILLMLLSAFLFYILIVLSLPIHTNWYTALWGRIDIFLQLLNPAHNITNIHKDITQYDAAMLWDTLARISSGYFIFQTIRAFRKYSR